MSKRKIWIAVLVLTALFLTYKFRQERGVDRKMVQQKVEEIILFEKIEAEKKCKKEECFQFKNNNSSLFDDSSSLLFVCLKNLTFECLEKTNLCSFYGSEKERKNNKE